MVNKTTKGSPYQLLYEILLINLCLLSWYIPVKGDSCWWVSTFCDWLVV